MRMRESASMELLYLLLPIIGAFILLFLGCCFGKKMREMLHIPKEVVLGRGILQRAHFAIQETSSESDSDAFGSDSGLVPDHGDSDLRDIMVVRYADRTAAIAATGDHDAREPDWAVNNIPDWTVEESRNAVARWAENSRQWTERKRHSSRSAENRYSLADPSSGIDMDGSSTSGSDVMETHVRECRCGSVTQGLSAEIQIETHPPPQYCLNIMEEIPSDCVKIAPLAQIHISTPSEGDDDEAFLREIEKNALEIVSSYEIIDDTQTNICTSTPLPMERKESLSSGNTKSGGQSFCSQKSEITITECVQGILTSPDENKKGVRGVHFYFEQDDNDNEHDFVLLHSKDVPKTNNELPQDIIVPESVLHAETVDDVINDEKCTTCDIQDKECVTVSHYEFMLESNTDTYAKDAAVEHDAACDTENDADSIQTTADDTSGIFTQSLHSSGCRSRDRSPLLKISGADGQAVTVFTFKESHANDSDASVDNDVSGKDTSRSETSMDLSSFKDTSASESFEVPSLSYDTPSTSVSEGLHTHAVKHDSVEHKHNDSNGNVSSQIRTEMDNKCGLETGVELQVTATPTVLDNSSAEHSPSHDSSTTKDVTDSHQVELFDNATKQAAFPPFPAYDNDTTVPLAATTETSQPSSGDIVLNSLVLPI